MPSFSELQTRQRELIRKGLVGSVFAKRREAADPEIEKLVDASGLLAIPTGYVDLGWVTKDQGVTWTRDVDTSDVMSLGAVEPTRRDITQDIAGLQLTAQESKAAVIGMHEGLDLSAVTHDADGNVSYDKPDRPTTLHYRVFVLFKDGEGADAIYFAKWLPSAQVTDRGEQQWHEGGEVSYALTLIAYVDDEVGTSVRSLWAGPTELIESMGFAAAGP